MAFGQQCPAALAMVGVERFISSQPQCSLLWRDPERRIFPPCAANGTGQIVSSPLAQGVLAGKYRPRRAPVAGHAGEQCGWEPTFRTRG
jgi:aryl-alcohol dehydrogenase-like predicted oxidoreductase